MTASVESHEPAHPKKVGPIRPATVVAGPDGGVHLHDEGWNRIKTGLRFPEDQGVNTRGEPQ